MIIFKCPNECCGEVLELEGSPKQRLYCPSCHNQMQRQVEEEERKLLEGTLAGQILTGCLGTPYEEVNHPDHYGGADNPYECIKIINELEFGFHVGTAFKHLYRAGKKPNNEEIKDLRKAVWYLNDRIKLLEKSNGN